MDCERPKAHRLRARRKALGLTQVQLAELAGVAEGSLRDLENQRHPSKARVQILMRLAVVLRCSVNDLIEDHWWDFPGRSLKAARLPGASSPPSRASSCARCGGALKRREGVNGEGVCVSCGQVRRETPKRILSQPAPQRRAA